MKEIFYTYIVHCSDDSYYTGVTNNIITRVNQHNSDEYPTSYCHTRQPVKLMFIRVFELIEDAIAFEKQIKGWSIKKKEALINGDAASLKKLAECQNSSHYRNHQ